MQNKQDSRFSAVDGELAEIPVTKCDYASIIFIKTINYTSTSIIHY